MRLFLFFLCCLVYVHSNGQILQLQDLNKQLTEELATISKNSCIKGFSVAIVGADQVFYQNGFGYSDFLMKSAYTDHTIQRVGSVSKVLIGLALLKAEELGAIHLDDPINKYLPYTVQNPSFPEEPITIRQLANHTSSILDSDYYDNNVYVLKEDSGYNGIEEMQGVFNDPHDSVPMAQFLYNILAVDGSGYSKNGFSVYSPGSQHQYSNVGAALAAHIVELSTGLSYPLFVEKHIFKPLKMYASNWSYDDENKQLSKLYYGDTVIPPYRIISYPDGGLYTSANDLARLLQELIKGYSGNGNVINEADFTKQFQYKGTIVPIDTLLQENPVFTVKYDTGIFMGKTDSGYYGHTGGDFGLVSLVFFDAYHKVGRILTVNTHIDGSNELCMDELWNIWNLLDSYKSKYLHYTNE